jgi:hypothetical protein
MVTDAADPAEGGRFRSGPDEPSPQGSSPNRDKASPAVAPRQCTSGTFQATADRVIPDGRCSKGYGLPRCGEAES